ncbi:hypothetical protein [Streptomyces sp. B21-083]|uniref:hypothetical protein n=1 Tax=Streptomyces sp. B21-083 TaxID=3039410 RepID=UPI002FF14290
MASIASTGTATVLYHRIELALLKADVRTRHPVIHKQLRRSSHLDQILQVHRHAPAVATEQRIPPP